MITLATSALVAFLSAIVLAMFGYLKNMSDEEFTPDKIFSTLLASIVAAFLIVQWNVPSETAKEMFIVFGVQTGFTTLLERLLKFVWRSWLRDSKWFEWLKDDDPQ